MLALLNVKFMLIKMYADKEGLMPLFFMAIFTSSMEVFDLDHPLVIGRQFFMLSNVLCGLITLTTVFFVGKKSNASPQ